jgi:hypothetical protein
MPSRGKVRVWIAVRVHNGYGFPCGIPATEKEKDCVLEWTRWGIRSACDCVSNFVHTFSGASGGQVVILPAAEEQDWSLFAVVFSRLLGGAVRSVSIGMWMDRDFFTMERLGVSYHCTMDRVILHLSLIRIRFLVCSHELYINCDFSYVLTVCFIVHLLCPTLFVSCIYMLYHVPGPSSLRSTVVHSDTPLVRVGAVHVLH